MFYQFHQLAVALISKNFFRCAMVYRIRTSYRRRRSQIGFVNQHAAAVVEPVTYTERVSPLLSLRSVELRVLTAPYPCTPHKLQVLTALATVWQLARKVKRSAGPWRTDAKFT